MSGKKETVLDLGKFIDKGVRVKLSGGREVTGTLKGFDQLLNLVLDDTKEFLKDPDDPYRLLDETRTLGLTVKCSHLTLARLAAQLTHRSCPQVSRGTSVMLVCPTEGFEEIANPFEQEGEEEEDPEG